MSATRPDRPTSFGPSPKGHLSALRFLGRIRPSGLEVCRPNPAHLTAQAKKFHVHSFKVQTAGFRFLGRISCTDLQSLCHSPLISSTKHSNLSICSSGASSSVPHFPAFSAAVASSTIAVQSMPFLSSRRFSRNQLGKPIFSKSTASYTHVVFRATVS